MKSKIVLGLAALAVAMTSVPASAQDGACYLVRNNGTTIECYDSTNNVNFPAFIPAVGGMPVNETNCAATPNGVFDPGATCYDFDDVVTYDEIDPVQFADCGEFMISGATLFRDFFLIPQVFNDFSNVDNDVIPCDGNDFATFIDTDCNGNPDSIDQLAPAYSFFQPWNGCWYAQYRSVGSGNGLAEFVNYQLTGTLPDDPPSELGVANGAIWANATGVVAPVGSSADCFLPNADTADLDLNGVVDGLDIDDIVAKITGDQMPIGPTGIGDANGDGLVDLADIPTLVDCLLSAGDCAASESGTPVCYQTVDGANLDVPSPWFVTIPAVNPGDAIWSQTPTADGYGDNPIGSSDTGYSNKLKSLSRGNETLNFGVGGVDQNTVFDTVLAYSPVVTITNQGTGIENLRFTEVQYILVTGRLPTGENIQACTRDSGSGTRNGHNNGYGVDPSWGAGDNLAPTGDRARNSAQTNVGPDTFTSNCGGSSIMENAVLNKRLAVGYTGLFGGSRAAADAAAGRYEVVNIMKDTAGGTVFVRPSVDAVLFNTDVDSSYQVGGLQSVVTRGDPTELDPMDPAFMENQAAAAFLRNINDSIANFVSPSGQSPDTFMPVQALVFDFVLPQGVSVIPPLTDPDDYSIPNANLVPAVQTAIQASQTTVVPAYGSVRPFGSVPTRNANAAGYTDGSTDGRYRNADGSLTLAAGTVLTSRMHIQGDFDVSGARDVDDIDELVAAVMDPAGFQAADVAANPGNFIIPEILGDFDGNGDLDAEDVRYFADGLAMNGGLLDRREGFTRVDMAAANYFGTALATGTYDNGDSRGDVAGDQTWPGGPPNGADGMVDDADIDYVKANFTAAWGSDLDANLGKDISCDMNGDLVVDIADVCEIVKGILDSQVGDVNLDGSVNGTDFAIINSNMGTGSSYAEGDVDCDGDVDMDDLEIANGTQASPC